MTTLIAAVARNGVIGLGNTIPWYLPEDFAHFKSVTRGHTVIMGSRTWESLPKKPLPNRLNIVISRNALVGEPLYGFADTVFAPSIGEAEFFAAATRPETETFIIGGAVIYGLAMPNATRLLISEVDLEPKGDTFFPPIGEEWTEVAREQREGFSIVDYRKLA